MTDTMMDNATQITNLLYRYGELFDQGRFDEVIELFHDACFVMADGDEVAPPDMRRLWDQLVILHDGLPRTRHLCTNPQIYIKGDEATCRSVYVVFQATARLPLQAIVSGTYHDRFFKTPEGIWSFRSRQYKTMDLVGDTSEHMRMDVLESLNTD
ncbi:MAG: nuclear transport factor 2 family protein [Parvibaculales bacterium]